MYGNRLSRTEYDGSLAVVSAQRFGYDGWKTGSGDSFVGQENWDVWADLDTSNALTTRRVFGNSIDDMAARITSAGVVGWYITDRQGSVREVVNAGGTPINTITYDGFGHATQTNASAGDRYLYTGREVDAVADLIHLRDRVMALDLNVFLTKDRMGFAAGDLNLYRYVGNGFTNGTDPSGQEEKSSDPSYLRWQIARKRDEGRKNLLGEINSHLDKDLRRQVLDGILDEIKEMTLHYKELTGRDIDLVALSKEYPLGMADAVRRQGNGAFGGTRSSANLAQEPIEADIEARKQFQQISNQFKFEADVEARKQFKQIHDQSNVLRDAIWLREYVLGGKDESELSIPRASLVLSIEPIISKTSKAWGMTTSEAIRDFKLGLKQARISRTFAEFS